VTFFDENIKNNYTQKIFFLTFGLDLDPDPQLDPDLHLSRRLDQDPHIMYADPKHWVPVLNILVMFRDPGSEEKQSRIRIPVPQHC
jgi:hypothetical protein